LAVLVATVIAVTPAGAAVHLLTHNNSTVEIDDASAAGMFNWTVDGVDQMSQQWFWYRIGSTGGESSIYTIDATPTAAVALGRILSLTYTADNIEIEILYTLTGGAAGSGTSDVAETISIHNTSSDVMELHFFQYSDFDLNGMAGGQTAQFISPQAF
jgi:hypothetical protein